MASDIRFDMAFDEERFKRDFLREMSLRSASDFDLVYAEMCGRVFEYVTIGHAADPLSAEVIE